MCCRRKSETKHGLLTTNEVLKSAFCLSPHFSIFFSLWLRLYFSPHTERLRQSLIRAELTGNAALPDRFNRSRPQDQMTAAAKGTAKKAIGLIRKTITARAAHFFCAFLYRHCTTTTWKSPISRFMEDVNKPLWNFLSHSELGYGFSGIQLQKSSPTFDKVIELELSRWRLNEQEFSF